MKKTFFQGNSDRRKILAGVFLFFSLAGWDYFLFLWTVLGYEWEIFPLELSFAPWVISFLTLPLFFKVCCGLVVLWWHFLLLHYSGSRRLSCIVLSLVLALGLVLEQFVFILNPVMTYRNSLKVNLKAEPVNPS